MTKWGRKNTTQTMACSTSNIFSKLWLSRFNNGSEGRESSNNNLSSDDDGFYSSLCSSEHKLNVSPVGYGKSSSNMTINDQPKIRDLMSGEAIEAFAFEDPTMKIKSNDQNHRKSFHISRKHGGKVKCCCKSPRKVAKALNFHPESATVKKPLVKTTERVIEDAFRTGLDSFAIVKTSYDPQHDFRESMIEMIMEKRIREPEELEELLACYLTLNCDRYHDLIVKVFRQVWFELNHVHHFDQQLDL